MSLPLYLLAAVVCVLLARRVGAVSARAAAALVLLPLCFTGRAMLTGGVYAPLDLAYTAEPLASVARDVGITHTTNPSLSDVAAQFIPWNAALRNAFRHGELPLWNRFELAGGPLAGAAQSAPYHPVTFLALLLPLAGGLTFTAAMTYLLAALSMFLFLRALELGELPSFFGAAAWAFSTYVMSFLLTAHGLSIAIAPLVFLGGQMVARTPSMRSAAVLTVALVLLTLAGHPETELHVVAVAVIYALFELLFVWRGLQSAPPERGLKPAPHHARRAIAYALGAGIAALLLCAIHLGPMLEAIPQTREYLHREHSAAAHSPLPLVAHLLRANFLTSAESLPHDETMSHGWVGSSYAGAIVFAPALAALFVRRRELWFFVPLVVFGWLAGAAAPGVADVLGRLPLFSIAVNTRLIELAAFGTCVLAAMGLGAPAARRMQLLLLGVAGALALSAAAIGLPFDAAVIRELIPLLLGIALIAAFPRAIPLAFIALLLMQRTAEMGSFIPTLDRRAADPPVAQLRELARQRGPFRVVAIGSRLTPNVATLFGLEDVRGYQAMTFAPLAETFSLWSIPQPVWFNRVDDLGAPMLSLMNVRYAIVRETTTPPAGWRALSPTLYENTRALPRAFVPRTLHVGPDAGSVAELAWCRDFGNEAWIASNEPPRVAPNGQGSVAIVRTGEGRFALHAAMQSPGWIVISEPAWKGWRATSGGRRLRLHVADHAFLAVYVAAGETEIELRYLPKGFVVGAAISALALVAGLLSFWVAGRSTQEPRNPATQ